MLQRHGTHNRIPQPLLRHNPPIAFFQLPHIPRIHPRNDRQRSKKADVHGEEAQTDAGLAEVVVPALAENVGEAREKAEEDAVDDGQIDGEKCQNWFGGEEGPGREH